MQNLYAWKHFNFPIPTRLKYNSSLVPFIILSLAHCFALISYPSVILPHSLSLIPCPLFLIPHSMSLIHSPSFLYPSFILPHSLYLIHPLSVLIHHSFISFFKSTLTLVLSPSICFPILSPSLLLPFYFSVFPLSSLLSNISLLLILTTFSRSYLFNSHS